LIPLMMAQLLLPFTGNLQRSAFASWLDQNLVDDPNATTAGMALEEDLRAQIRELSHEAKDLSTLIREASILVADHSDRFRIPLHHDFSSGNWALGDAGAGSQAGDRAGEPVDDLAGGEAGDWEGEPVVDPPGDQASSKSSPEMLLLHQWNWFSHQKNSVKGVMPELFKPLATWMPAWSGFDRAGLKGDSFGRAMTMFIAGESPSFESFWLQPFLSGVSIHAP